MPMNSQIKLWVQGSGKILLDVTVKELHIAPARKVMAVFLIPPYTIFPWTTFNNVGPF